MDHSFVARSKEDASGLDYLSLREERAKDDRLREAKPTFLVPSSSKTRECSRRRSLWGRERLLGQNFIIPRAAWA